MKTSITEKQKKVLGLIYESITSSGFPPTFADLKELLNLSSNQAVLNYLISLEKQGFIKREEGQARGIKIAPLGLKILGKQRLAPVVGMVAAGPCIESFSETHFKWVELPAGIAENDKIKKSEVTGEYYLPELIKIALITKQKVHAMLVHFREI